MMRHQLGAIAVMVVVLWAGARAQELFEPLPMVSSDGREMLTLSCRAVAEGAVLECARSKVIVDGDGGSCTVGNRMTQTALVRVRPGLWQANLPVRIDTLRCDGSVCSFEEAEKVDAAHPRPPKTRYESMSSSASLPCSSFKFAVF